MVHQDVCGGQGDLLSGALVAAYYWAIHNQNKAGNQSPSSEQQPAVTKITPAQIAGYAASTLIRTSSQTVFNKLGRAMLSVDVLKEIGPVFSKLYEK